MAKAYLCLGCGHVMGRGIGGCVSCRSKHLLCYDNDRSPTMLERQRAIRGQGPKQATATQAHIIVVAVLSVFMGTGWYVTTSWKEISANPAVANALAAVSAIAPRRAQPPKTEVAATEQKIH